MDWVLFASGGHGVSGATTAFFAVLLLGLIVALALEEKIHAKKSVIAGIVAVVCLLCGTVADVLPFGRIAVGSYPLTEHNAVHGEYVEEDDGNGHEIDIGELRGEAEQIGAASHPLHVGGHRISMPVYIPGIDWGVIAIIFGSSLFVDVTSRSGLFTWIAIKVTKASAGDPIRLLVFYGIMTVLFSAVLNNVTAMIIVGSLTAVSLEKLDRRNQLLGFLLIEGLLTNVGGLLTLISSVPNILVGTAAGISFTVFFVKSVPYVFVATLLTVWMGARYFGIKRLVTDDERMVARELVDGFDENDGVESWPFFYFSSIMLVLFILTIATTSVLPGIRNLEMGFVALAFAGIMLLRYKAVADQFYKAIDWDLLGFFMSLFVVIYVMEHALVLNAIGEILKLVLALGEKGGTAALLVASAVFSSVTDNIPLAAMLAKILSGLGTPGDSPFWWAIVFGANLGGNITPIGSASTLVAVTIMHKHELPISFSGFVMVAVPFAAVQILLATIYVLFVMPWIG